MQRDVTHFPHLPFISLPHYSLTTPLSPERAGPYLTTPLSHEREGPYLTTPLSHEREGSYLTTPLSHEERDGPYLTTPLSSEERAEPYLTTPLSHEERAEPYLTTEEDDGRGEVSEEDVRAELCRLGFPEIPRQRLLQFKEDLERLMRSRPAENIPDSSRGSDSHTWSYWPASDPEPLPRGQEKRRVVAVTRKVLRKRSDGHVEVCDESTLSSDKESLLGDGDATLPTRHSVDGVRSFIRVPSYSLLEQYRHHSDPVHRYHDYKHGWTTGQRLLERHRKEVRRGVRERMMSAPTPPLPRPIPPPNTYIIPTDKKRYGLRWAIRQDLVNGHVPRGGHS
ncbi:centriolar and ciliogenesis-associated protein HYLS1 [Mantella aurantiaca]